MLTYITINQNLTRFQSKYATDHVGKVDDARVVAQQDGAEAHVEAEDEAHGAYEEDGKELERVLDGLEDGGDVDAEHAHLLQVERVTEEGEEDAERAEGRLLVLLGVLGVTRPDGDHHHDERTYFHGVLGRGQVGDFVREQKLE